TYGLLRSSENIPKPSSKNAGAVTSSSLQRPPVEPGRVHAKIDKKGQCARAEFNKFASSDSVHHPPPAMSLTGYNGLSDLLFLVDRCNYWAGQELVTLQCNGGWGR